MKTGFSFTLGLILIGIAFSPALRADTARNATELLKRVDELYRSESSMARFEMEIITPHWKRTLKIDAWSQGMDKTFLRILEPKKERGMTTLRIENEMWNFLPKTNKVMKIPPSMMMGSWMGSDFTNDDLVKEYTFLKDYHFEETVIEGAREGEIYIRCTPKPDRPIVWGHIIVAVREKDDIPLWQKFYDEKGVLMREMIYRDIRTFDKRTIPSVMELISTTRKGNRTIVRYLEASFDINIPAGTFSLRNLRSRI
jgi:outer membrane lipoprotein-sorting protein